MIPRQFTQALRTSIPRRAAFTTKAAAVAPAPRLVSNRHLAQRSISSTPEVNGPEPSHAAVREDIQIPYVFFSSLSLGNEPKLTSFTKFSPFSATPSSSLLLSIFGVACADSEVYNSEGDFKPGDLGHSMDGKDVDVGRHTRRTLASFSMTDKVSIYFQVLQLSEKWVAVKNR